MKRSLTNPVVQIEAIDTLFEVANSLKFIDIGLKARQSDDKEKMALTQNELAGLCVVLDCLKEAVEYCYDEQI
ncbi:MAG: hypothetical protein HRT35_38095 [Algicola sp.]|nr:hypothetical protein [Algicola sp.]